ESLARRWLGPEGPTSPLASVDAVSVPLPECVRALLMNSMAFCHLGLERLLMSWRANLCAALREVVVAAGKRAAKKSGNGGGAEEEGQEDVLTRQLDDAAALACHLHFAGYCVPLRATESGDSSEVLACQEARQALLSTKLPELSGWAGGAALLLTAMYENPAERLESDAETLAFLRRRAPCCPAVAMLLDRCLKYPREEAASVPSLELLATAPATGPDDSTAIQSEIVSETPCRAFYDSIAYPPWLYAVESAGMLPSTPCQRWRRYFPWWRGSDVDESGRVPRVLIAGCGSGHQVALELRSYSGCQVVALDVSPLSLARAKRKMRAVLTSSEFGRVRFILGDIMDIDANSALVGGGFDLVVCGGVLMCLKDPDAGLARLAACMLPGGALHLATYSRYSNESWRAPVVAYLCSAPASRHLYESCDAPPMEAKVLREPSQAELQAIRTEVLALPSGHE
ncbi:unnamed protein product, partial [Polarella glacialis]